MRSFWTRCRTRVPCIGRRIFNHCTTREATKQYFKNSTSLKHYSHGSAVEVEGDEEEYSFCHIFMWLRKSSGGVSPPFCICGSVDCSQLSLRHLVWARLMEVGCLCYDSSIHTFGKLKKEGFPLVRIGELHIRPASASLGIYTLARIPHPPASTHLLQGSGMEKFLEHMS